MTDIRSELSKIRLEKAKRELDLLDRETTKADLEIALAQAELEEVRRNDSYELSRQHYAGIYTFYDDVDERSVRQAMQTLGEWSRRSIKEGKPQDFTLILNSPGGSVLDGVALYDFVLDLRAQGHKVTTIALGTVASMGGVLFQAGDERIMGKTAWYLIHEVSAGAIGNVSELKDRAEFVERLNDQLFTILAERSKMSKQKMLNRAKRKDWWMNAEEALEIGLCDVVR